jgi:hypothetical protein
MRAWVYVLAFLLLSAPCFGATWYVDQDASGANDGTSWGDAFTTLQAAVNALAADGDEIIIDDETHLIAADIEDNTVSYAGNASFTVKSKSGDPTTCIISSNSATDPIWYARDGSYSYNWTFENIGFTKSVAHTSASYGALYRRVNNTSTVTYSGCKIDGITITYTGNASVGGLWNINSAAWTLTLTDTTISNITMNGDGNCFGLLLTYADGENVVETNTLYSGITFIQDADDGADAFNGWYTLYGTYTGTNIIVEDITSTHINGGAGNHFGLYRSARTEAGTDFTMNGITLRANANTYSYNMTGGAIQSCLMRIFGDGVVYLNDCADFYVYDDHADTPSNGLGAIVVAYQTDANVSIYGGYVHDGICQHGCTAYATQGGSVYAERVKSYRLDARGRAGGSTEPGYGGAYYCGGSGNMELRYCLIQDCRADIGGGAYVGNNGTGTKTFDMHNCTLINNLADEDLGSSGGDNFYASVADTATINVDIRNCIFWGDDDFDSNNIELDEGNNANMNLTFDYNDLKGGSASISEAITNGTYTYGANNVNVDPSFTPIFSLDSDSTLINYGTDISGVHDQSTPATDVAGSSVTNKPDLGCFENKGSGGRAIIIVE